MITSFTTSNYTNLKGFIAELICEYHFSKLNYNVIPLGNEKISGLLPSISTLFSVDDAIVKDGTYDSNTFSILQNLTQHLPDFVIWKLAYIQNFNSNRIPNKNILKISFVEVKYRRSIKSRDLNIENSEGNDPLSLYKYLNFIEEKAKENNLDINLIDFYVYLITYDNRNKKHIILFGKVLKNPEKEGSYKLNLYDKVRDNFNRKTGNKWDDYNRLLDFLQFEDSKKLNYLFNQNFIISIKNKSESEIRRLVFDKLNEIDY
ncbi:hypothetical protein [Riemerella columbina]|uniref:hypothetical protein n=1 Tax=Riemerella columbina TaxID=103810 RepID=UPI0003796A0C|nr:hypothetical protein [Riemerella columbina]